MQACCPKFGPHYTAGGGGCLVPHFVGIFFSSPSPNLYLSLIPHFSCHHHSHHIHTHFLVASFLRTSFSVPTVPSRNIDFRPSLGACESTALNLGIFMWRRLYGDSRSSWDLSTGLWNDISLPELRTNYAIAVSFYSCSTSLPLPSTHTPSPVDILHSFFDP